MTKHNLFTASLWSLTLTWGTKILSIVSIFVLARLLTPEDFGLVSVAFIFYNFLLMVSEAGNATFIIKTERLDDDHLHKVWSINFCLKLAVALVLCISATPIAQAFGNEKIANIVYAYAGLIAIQSLGNFWQPLLQRALNVKPITVVGFSAKLTSFIVTLFIAVYYESYWALVVGEVINVVALVIAGYWIHPYRPKMVSPVENKIWSFFIWMLGERLLGFVRGKSDSMVIGKFFGTEALGAYTLANRIQEIPSNDVMHPLTQPIISSLNKLKSDLVAFKNEFTAVLFSINLLFAVLCFCIIISSELIVDLLLGEQWWQVASILQILPLGIYFFATINLCNQLMILIDKNKLRFWIDIAYTGIIFASLLSTALLLDLTSLFIVRAALYFLGACILLVTVYKVLDFSAGVLFNTTFSPFIGAYFCFYLSELAAQAFRASASLPELLVVIVQLLVFVLTFAAFVLTFIKLNRDQRVTKHLQGLIDKFYKAK